MGFSNQTDYTPKPEQVQGWACTIAELVASKGKNNKPEQHQFVDQDRDF
ncbi:MAG: hypothetical protein MUO40_00455 [Anaerolineaceae bacterium]|nr:hypothetical protein [Anaerolineaceae bacterium]